MSRSVYAILDPTTGDVRYIGQTGSALEHRLQEHVYCVNAALHIDSPLYQWIGALLKRGKRPDIIALAKGIRNKAEATCIESALISFHVSNGSRLFNVQFNPRSKKK